MFAIKTDLRKFNTVKIKPQSLGKFFFYKTFVIPTGVAVRQALSIHWWILINISVDDKRPPRGTMVKTELSLWFFAQWFINVFFHKSARARALKNHYKNLGWISTTCDSKIRPTVKKTKKIPPFEEKGMAVIFHMPPLSSMQFVGELCYFSYSSEIF